MKYHKILAIGLYVAAFAAFALPSRAQQPAPTGQAAATGNGVLTFELESGLMKRRVPYAVFLPVSYEADQQKRFPVVYLLHGLSGSYKTFAENRERLADYPKRSAIFVFVEGGTSFFTDSAKVEADRYESYFIKELIPEIDKKYRTIAERRGRAIAGVSMGGYGALKLGIKYPELFSLAASWSGVVNAASWRKIGELPPRPRTVQAITAAFGDGSDPKTLIANDLFKLLADLPEARTRELPFFYLDCGTEDELLPPNQKMAELLLTRKIPHEFRQLPGGHGLQDHRVSQVLDLYERLLAADRERKGPRASQKER